MLACRVPVPFPDFNSTFQIHQHALSPPQHSTHALPATLAGTAEAQFAEQQETPLAGAHKLLSLPSFAKVVYNTAAGTPAKPATASHSMQPSQQLSSSVDSTSSIVQPAANTDRQQPVLQRASSLKAASLEFDSQFESGNLQKAVQARPSVSL